MHLADILDSLGADSGGGSTWHLAMIRIILLAAWMLVAGACMAVTAATNTARWSVTEVIDRTYKFDGDSAAELRIIVFAPTPKRGYHLFRDP